MTSAADSPSSIGSFSRRQANKTSHVLAHELRRRILSGELGADEQVRTEAQLTAALGVARETLREALRILESQSLIEVRRGRGGGVVIRRPDFESVGRYVALLLQIRGTTYAHLEEARSVLEPAIAEQFAVRCGAADLDVLAQLHEKERTEGTDPLEFVTALAKFDHYVGERCGNRSLGVIAGIFREIYLRQITAAVVTAPDGVAMNTVRELVVTHGRFLDAARRRNGGLARAAWREYLSATTKLLASRGASRRTIDVVPLWRMPAPCAEPASATRLATSVAAEIRARIAEGRLTDGDRLPGLAGLADEFGISRPTLREALRILEMEFLVDLRPGDRNGPRVRLPTTQVAAQLAGTLFESRETTLEDFYGAVILIEPTMMELAATRMGSRALATVESLEAELAASSQDVPELIEIWTQIRTIAFGATDNPALGVIAEILHWVRLGTQPAVTANAATQPTWIAETHHLAMLFAELVDALADRDATHAAGIWAACLTANSPYIESSGLGRRLVIDLIG